MTSAVVHGGVTGAELTEAEARGIQLTDLSASLNPYGPHPRVVAAAAGAVISRYPEADALGVREVYAAARGIAPDKVLAGNGSSELIYLVTRALGNGGRCLVAGPTFGEYAAAARAAGMIVDEFGWFEPCATQTNIAGLARRIEEERPALVFLCNPNNPTGTLTSRVAIEELTAIIGGYRGRLVVDEAYMDFAWPEDEAVGPAEGRLVLRSLTKLHAIPGLRAGFLMGTPDDIERVGRQQPPWSFSAPAAAAVLQALRERDFADDSRRRVAETRARLVNALTAEGFETRSSLANFVLVRVGDAPAFRRRMLARGFVLRDCTSFGLPGHVRVAIPPDNEAAALVTAMKEER